MKKSTVLGLAMMAAFGAFAANCYTLDNSKGNVTLGRETYIDSTDRFIIYCGTVNIAEGCFVRSGGNDNGACNFIGVDRNSAASVLNINGGTFWCASSKGAGVLGVGNNNNAAQATVNVNSGEFKVDTRLRMSSMWNGTAGATSSGTVNVNGGEVTVKEFYVGATSSSSGTATLNLVGGITRTQKITFPAYNGQVFKFNGGILEAQAANIFTVATYAGSGTRTLEVVDGKTSIFRTGGFNQNIPAMTGTGFLRLSGGGIVTFAEKSLTYGLVLDGVGLDLGLLDPDTTALTATKKIELRSPLTIKVTLPANPTGKYPLIGNCETVTAAGVMANATVVGGGAGKLVYQDKTIYLDFGSEVSDGLVLSDAAGGALTPAEASYSTLLFEKTAGEYTIGGTGLTFTYGLSDGAPGRQTITAPVNITTASETIFVEEGSTLDLAGGLTATTQIVKDGKGTLALSHSTRPTLIRLREGTLDLGGGTYTGTLDYWNSRRIGGSEIAYTNGVYRPAALTHIYYPDCTLRILDGFTLDLRNNNSSRIAIGINGVNQTDKHTKMIIDGGTVYTAGDQASFCNFINPDHNGTAELIINRGAFYAATANGSTLRIATGNNRNTTGYLKIHGGLLHIARDLTMATQYNGIASGAGRAFFEQTGGVAEIYYFYLGASNTGTGEGTVTLTGGELKIKMLKCLQYNKQTLVCDGAKITALQNDTDSVPFMTQLGNGDTYARSYSIGANGLEINTAGFNVRDDLPFSGTGGMSVTGAGTLNLNCVHTFGGAFTVGAGTTVNLKQMRAFHSGVTLGANARLKVAASADEATTVAGAVTLGAGAKLVFDLDAAECATASLTATGGFTLPQGATDVTDFVDITDAAKYEASVDGNTITVHLKDLTVPTDAVWTGAGVAGDYTDADNWECRNAVGEVLASVVPTAATTIRVSGNTSFTLPANSVLPRKEIVLGNPTAHRRTQMGRVTYGVRNAMTDTSWAALGLGSYLTFADGDVANLNGLNTAWQNSNLDQAQLRFEGWFHVPAAKAGEWSIQQSFDDYFAFYIDGTQIIANPTYQCSNSATCGVSEGWHRFKIVCGDTTGGQGSSLDFGGTKVPMTITCNGSTFALTDLTFGTESNTITLTADCDWRGLGTIAMTEALVVDLNGHNLTLSGYTTDDIVGSRFVNTDSEHVSQLVLDIPQNTTFNRGDVFITGNIRFVKQGAGTYRMTKKYPYSGGTDVLAGSFYMDYSGYDLGSGGDVHVATGAVLDTNGHYVFNNRLVLDGGTYQNTGAGAGSGTAQQPNIVLTTNSTFRSMQHLGLVGYNYGATSLDLQGHTLSVEIGTGNIGFWLFNTDVTAGRIELRGDGWIEVNKTSVRAAQTDFLIDCRINIVVPIDVHDYDAVHSLNNYCNGTGGMKVHGTFTPHGGLFYGCVMQDGSTIDLSGKSDTWSTTRTVNIGDHLTAPDTVTFADDATVTIDVHGRRFSHDNMTKVVSWEEAPENLESVAFVLDEQSLKRNYLRVLSDGIYVGDRGGTVIYIR